jgi:hypothetical protein
MRIDASGVLRSTGCFDRGGVLTLGREKRCEGVVGEAVGNGRFVSSEMASMYEVGTIGFRFRLKQQLKSVWRPMVICVAQILTG